MTDGFQAVTSQIIDILGGGCFLMLFALVFVPLIFLILLGSPLLFLGLLFLGGIACEVGAALPPPPPEGTEVPGMITVEWGESPTPGMAEEAVGLLAENLPEGAEAGETCGLLQPAAEGDVEVYLDGAVGFVLGVVIQITEGFQFV